MRTMTKTPFDLLRAGLATTPVEPPHLPAPKPRTAHFADYHFSEDIAVTVNVAIRLGRPLLVTGEPGTGKTALAWGIARAIGAEGVLEFHARSDSGAKDLFYMIDNLRRFHDAGAGVEEARSVGPYISWQALGRAIRSDERYVVLIDEIDKAPRDFPNDLLNAIDRMEFDVPEMGTGEVYRAKTRHVLVVTSNSERQLPPAFLRRCVYLHLPFPAREMLESIVKTHTDGQVTDALRSIAVERFLQLRAVPGLSKRPATDELIAWTQILAAMDVDADELAGTVLADLPALGALLKSTDDFGRIDAASGL
jgi:MoxR-like ATPase